MININKYLFVYLAIAFGASYGVTIVYLFFPDVIVPITGELTLMHPITIVTLYSPSIAGLIAYYMVGGGSAVKGVLAKFIPRKQDLFWFPIIIVVFFMFAATMHFGSKLFGIPVPEITFTVPEMIGAALFNLIKETGLIGGVLGWIGFLLPALQTKFKSNIVSGLLTGFSFGLWVLPGYVISSFGTSTSYIYYVIQLMVFVVFISYIFNATKGNLLFYLVAFWLAATGSQIQLYFFNPQVQIMQITYFTLAAIIIHLVFKAKKVNPKLQTFPEFINSGAN
ncbi:hypothetical protein NQ117_11465 [Paenibacillus sp. SC116]|uniref:hypothetical protein n=1 Tax=Paenibacillus sp. SC116 TaxID=2968986 RepID=UPI00215AAD1A|nr:hypothetical protein [Paenibacillus sp. SC116]MCR8844304.1 hypothetical protein [Paenibacillus sp. SC116]